MTFRFYGIIEYDSIVYCLLMDLVDHLVDHLLLLLFVIMYI